MADRHFGELPGITTGAAWLTRREAAAARVHRPTVGGICGTKADGAESIVVSGGYEDDLDLGSEILYTGAGGNDPGSKKQIADQSLEHPGNAGMVTSQLVGLPVRVIRGANGDPTHSPASGFRYDGLYRVADHWSEIGKSGHRIWRYRLVRLTAREASPFVPPTNLPPGNPKPKTSTGVTTRIVRSTAVAVSVKKLYDDYCQVCDTRLEVPGGAVSEGAHIRALGRPHLGPDVPENVLCLCPNHHALFDDGGIFITTDLKVRDYLGNLLGPLNKHGKHPLDQDHLRYHRELWGR